MILVAFFYCHTELGSIRPAWLFLLLGGVVLLFATRYSMVMETGEFDEDWNDFDELEYNSFYDSSMYLESPMENDNIAYSQWLSEKQEARRQQELLIEQEEDEQADSILEKLHSSGGDLECLTPEERGILHRFSERIRRRRQQSV